VVERIVVAVLSLVVAACFAVAFTAARAEDRLSELQFRPPRLTQTDLRRAGRLEQDAGRLTTGERRVLLLASVRLRAGDADGALRLARAAVRREPENAEAWLAVSRAARQADPPLAREALQRLRELVPPVPAP
jgi:cytochrome c-type biogenesis protein CcmH/NrfG